MKLLNFFKNYNSGATLCSKLNYYHKNTSGLNDNLIFFLFLDQYLLLGACIQQFSSHGEQLLSMQESFDNKTELSTLTYRFRIIDLKEHPSNEFINFEEPELLILALLMKTESTSKTFQVVLEKLVSLVPANELNNHLAIIEILIQSRKDLPKIFKEKVKEMGLEYNIKKTESYKIGMEAGVENTLKNVIINTLKERFSEDLEAVEKKISELTDSNFLNELQIKAVTIESVQKFLDLL